MGPGPSAPAGQDPFPGDVLPEEEPPGRAFEVAGGDAGRQVAAGGGEEAALPDLRADDHAEAGVGGDLGDPQRGPQAPALRYPDVEGVAGFGLDQGLRLGDRPQ